MIREIIDDNLEQDPNWQSHIPSDGSAIGGVNPQSFIELQTIPGQSNEILFFTKGVAYATAEGYLVRPWFPLPVATFSYSLMVDANTAAQAQLIETDIIVLDMNGIKYNGSVQINIQEGWMIQIANSAGGWVDTGIKIAPLTADVQHPIAIRYLIDSVKRTISVVSYTVDGTVYNVPAALQNIPGVASPWTKSTVLVQVQQTVNGNGGGYSIELSKIRMRYSLSS